MQNCKIRIANIKFPFCLLQFAIYNSPLCALYVVREHMLIALELVVVVIFFLLLFLLWMTVNMWITQSEMQKRLSLPQGHVRGKRGWGGGDPCLGILKARHRDTPRPDLVCPQKTGRHRGITPRMCKDGPCRHTKLPPCCH